jgi:type VI secretion system protein VasI
MAQPNMQYIWRVPLAFVFLSGVSDAPNATELHKEIARCAIIAGDLERVECFDDVAMRSGLDGPQAQHVTASGGTGKWENHRDNNPIDDAERVVIALNADTGKSQYGDIITFVARCQSNETEVYINWNDYLGDDSSSVYREWKYVTIRIGDSKAQRQQWSVSTDKKATFAPDWAGDLLKQMAHTEKFLAQGTPYSEAPVTAIFDTRGMKAALGPLAETCGWSLD